MAVVAGGKTEYIVTIACVIGRSRMKVSKLYFRQEFLFGKQTKQFFLYNFIMKGERVVTNLLPYGPEKPRYRYSLLIVNSYKTKLNSIEKFF